ncbi:MAG TPA: sulfur oxidation c-type cytochrome SoxA [Hyphomicrobiales bacterium]|nr:sulfur oxidation c-type cytochrome SoxA [Hyphomicrobiales bacterium]
MRRTVGIAFFIFLIGACGARCENAGLRNWRSQPPADDSNPLKQLIPGEDFLPPRLRAQQADDFDNPAYPAVEAGERAWSTPEGLAGKSCQTCHGASRSIAIKQAAASYPKYAPDVKQVITLETRINICRRNNLRAVALNETSEQLIAMSAYLRWVARGLPSAVSVTGPSAEIFEHGKQLFYTKMGLLKLSCAQCHNERYGEKFGGETLSQGHPLAYPAYKVSEGRVITLHERFQFCNKLVRAEPQPENSPDYIALELYLNWRSKNLPITAPGVRR